LYARSITVTIDLMIWQTKGSPWVSKYATTMVTLSDYVSYREQWVLWFR